MNRHCCQALHLGMRRDDSDPAASAPQLRGDTISRLEVLSTVGQDHQVAARPVRGGTELIERDVTLGGQHRHSAERGDGFCQSRTGDDDQYAPLARGRTRLQRSDPDLAQFTERQRGLDCRPSLAEVNVYLCDGLVAHNDNAMAEL
jgi:hypothetical protein